MPVRSFRSGAGFILSAVARLASLAVLDKIPRSIPMTENIRQTSTMPTLPKPVWKYRAWLIVGWFASAKKVSLVLLLILCGAGKLDLAISLAADHGFRSTSEKNNPSRAIDRLLQASWKENEINPSPPATEGEWCRRVFLDVIGRIPTTDELDAFLKDPSPEKKKHLVERLLSTDYSAAYTRNWENIWTNILIGRSGGSERNSRTNRQGMQMYLQEAFAENRPYDQMALELISAQGTSRPPDAVKEASQFNGAVNFLAMKLGNDPNDADYGAQAAAKTSQIFMGLRVQCTQCHDHPFNRWKQNQFWELNAFFRQTVALRRFEGGRNIAFIELNQSGFSGPNERTGGSRNFL